MIALPFPEVSNRLLRALPDRELRVVGTFLKEVNLDCGETLYFLNEPLEYVYFPEDSLISSMTAFENGDMIEQGCIGPEGILGAGLCLSKTISTGEVRVRLGGRALRMKADHFCRLMADQPVLEKLVKEYMLVFMQQISQTGACNCFHSINARLAKMLLTYVDRTGSRQIKLTHENMSEILGCARPVVSEAASQLKEKGLISYVRGSISLLDAQCLKAEACECYEIIRRIYESYDLQLSRQTIASNSDYSRYSPVIERNYHSNRGMTEIIEKVPTLVFLPNPSKRINNGVL